MNILKNNSTLLSYGSYNKLAKIVCFDELYDRITSSQEPSKYRFFEVVRKENFLILYSSLNILDISSIDMIKEVLDEKQGEGLTDLFADHTININYKKRIMSLLHLDIISCYERLKSDNLSDSDRQGLISYLKYGSGVKNIEHLLKEVIANNTKRSNIHSVNKNSAVVHLLDENLSQNLNKLSELNISLIRSNPLLSFVEVQSGFDNVKLECVMQEVARLCSLALKKHNDAINFKFNLKFRKIKRTFKNGIYIPSTNTIIVDPRHTQSFLHELGHWYHHHYRPDITSKKQAEEFAENFNL